MTDVLFDPTNGNVAYAATYNHFSSNTGGPVFKSTDAGATWSQADAAGTSTLPTGIGVGRVAIAIAPSDTSILFALIEDEGAGPNPGSLLGVFRSTDAGKNWTQVANPDTPNRFCGGQCWYDLDLRVSPADPATLFAGGFYVYRSTDSGNTWQDTSGASGTNLHTDSHALAFSNPAAGPLKLYFGNDGGAWRSDNPTAAIGSYGLTNLNATLAIAQFYPGLSVHPSSENFGFGGTQDNGSLSYSGSLPWTEVGGGDGWRTIIDQQMPSVVYISCEDFCLARSNSSGQPGTFSGLPLTGVSDGLAPFFIPSAGDPNQTGRIYLALRHVFQSNDYGDSWTEISPQLDSDTITAVAVAPGNSDVVYAVTARLRVWRTVNATLGASSGWSELTKPAAPSGNMQFTQVAINPFDPNTAIATLSGFGAPHVFLTANGGVSWANISGTGAGALPDIPVNDVVIDPDPTLAANTFYIGTDVGVFWTSDAGNTWAPLGTGLPNAAVLSLALRKQSRILRAGTHGRSVWALQLPAPAVPDFTISLAAPAQASLAGGTATYSASLIASNGFSQPVTITCSSAPPGVTCLAPPPVTPSDSGATATISVTVPAALPPSTTPYSFTITATSGSLSHSAQAQILVATLSATISPGATNINVGSSANFNVSVTANDNFAGPVSLNCAGLAPGLRCVTPAPISVPGSATLTVFVDSMPGTSALPPHSPVSPSDSAPWNVALVTLLLLIAAFAIWRRHGDRVAFLSQGLALALLLLLAIGLISCGGAATNSNGSNGSTAAGTTATGTTGAGGSGGGGSAGSGGSGSGSGGAGSGGSGGTGGSGGSGGTGGAGSGGSGGTGGSGGSGGTGGSGGGNSVTSQITIQAQSGGAVVNLGTVSITVP